MSLFCLSRQRTPTSLSRYHVYPSSHESLQDNVPLTFDMEIEAEQPTGRSTTGSNVEATLPRSNALSPPLPRGSSSRPLGSAFSPPLAATTTSDIGGMQQRFVQTQRALCDDYELVFDMELE